MERYPENYADKDWINNICRKNENWNLYDRLIVLSGVNITDQKIVVGKKANGKPIKQKAKEYARDKYKNIILGKKFDDQIILKNEMMEFDFNQNLNYLPRLSFFLTFKFQLKKPYISRDDTPFYIIDNPVRKDKVSKFPMVSASQWKGALQAVMIRHVVQQMELSSESGRKAHAADRAAIIGLFGDESKAVFDYFRKVYEEDTSTGKSVIEDKLKVLLGRLENLEPSKLAVALKKIDLESFSKSGRLRFYPAFFDKIGLEIINPHDRVRRVGINPIYIETSPSGARATFTLLYVPMDLMGQPSMDIRRAVARDLELLGRALPEMFTRIGFGAKISSGFGVAEDEVENGYWTGKGFARIQRDRNGSSDPPRMPEALRKFLDKNPDTDFSVKVSDFPGNKKKRAAFRKAKELYQISEKERQKWRESLVKQKEKSSDSESFNSFEALSDLLKKYAESLREYSNDNS